MVYGCALSKYSTEFAVTMEVYGSATARGTALASAQSQCGLASWASWFCSSAVDSCALESSTLYSCTFEKYSTTQNATMRFYGSGRGKTEAKAAAVSACIASGNWKGWFCSSGTLTCTPG